MNSLVQIAYKTVNQFELSKKDTQTLIAMLQGSEQEQIEESREKLKKVPEELLEEVTVLRELLKRKPFFPPKKWNGYHKGIKVF